MRGGVLGEKIAVLAEDRIKIALLEVGESAFVSGFGSRDMLTLNPRVAVRLSAVVAFTVQRPTDRRRGHVQVFAAGRRQRFGLLVGPADHEVRQPGRGVKPQEHVLSRVEIELFARRARRGKGLCDP